jgi:hypothetical protein
MVSQKVINADRVVVGILRQPVILREAKDLAFRLRINKAPSFT